MINKLLAGVLAGMFVATLVFLWNSEEPPKEIPRQETITQPVTQPIVEEVDGKVGAQIPIVVSRFETSLASSITNSDTSMNLVSGTDRVGNSISGFYCFTIDEGTSVVEDVCGTASGTAITTLTRGISPVTGTSSVASLKFSHRRGASVKLTDYPQLAILSRIINGNETIPNQLVYESTVSTTTMASNLQNVASVGYVNSVSISGASDASTVTKGIVQAATGAQIAISTAAGSTGALLFPPSTLFSSTSSATILVPVTRNNGKLAQGFLDLTESYTWTGAVIFNSATTTLNATTSIAASASNKLFLNNIGYSLPSSQGAASTTLVNNGSGVLTWGTMSSIASSTSGFTFSGIPATSTLATLTFTPSTAQKVMLMGTVQASNNSNSGVCRLVIDVDGAATTTVSTFTLDGGGAGKSNHLNFSFLTSQLSAAEHNIRLMVTPSGGTECSSATYYNSNQFSALYFGN